MEGFKKFFGVKTFHCNYLKIREHNKIMDKNKNFSIFLCTISFIGNKFLNTEILGFKPPKFLLWVLNPKNFSFSVSIQKISCPQRYFRSGYEKFDRLQFVRGKSTEKCVTFLTVLKVELIF